MACAMTRVWVHLPTNPGPQPRTFAPGDTLPLDPAVTKGTLSNGLRFYIRRNGRPAKRVEMQLAAKAGSVDEEDNQQGLAHVVEHMAFNGSRHFKPGELVAAFESTGARLGPHVNAYTSFDETVYMARSRYERGAPNPPAWLPAELRHLSCLPSLGSGPKVSFTY
ncbi:MAG: hypothetical protein A3G21_03855 [Acidobacteria bacterium RIFCSPLOWO2_12_FULL_66_21]|nr:MAG: hypothetical protein A3G21_03855 [Acidobacteria bacterium RIFCSPLOWO2_12_FULL_66_21]